jgi:hypothetical protein
MVQVIVMEYGPSGMLRRFSDPVWFQSFGSVLGFDWHHLALQRLFVGLLKRDGRKGIKKDPIRNNRAGDKYGLSNDLSQLQRTSRMVAKVDSAAVQDGYQLYHHFFVFDRLDVGFPNRKY